MHIKRHILTIMFCSAVMCASAQCRTPSHDCQTTQCHCPDSMQAVSPSTLIIWYDNSAKANKKRLMRAVRKYKASVIYDYRSFSGIAIRIPNGTDINAAIDYFKKVKGVLSVNRDRIMHLDNAGE